MGIETFLFCKENVHHLSWFRSFLLQVFSGDKLRGDRRPGLLCTVLCAFNCVRSAFSLNDENCLLGHLRLRTQGQTLPD